MRRLGVVSVGLLGIGAWAWGASAAAMRFDCAPAGSAADGAVCASPAGDAAQAPAAGRRTLHLDLDAPGWVTIRTESRTGVALRLIDMIAGPVGAAGEAGQRDGRLDALLDRGRYKLVLTGAEAAADQVTVTAARAADVQSPAPPLAQAPGDTLAASLGDGQQRSYWITVGPEPVAILAAGRALADLRLWRDGTELAPQAPTLRLSDLAPGRPQRVLSLAGTLEPGRYKLTLYGGEPLRWTDGAADMPVTLRTRSPRLAGLDVRSGTLGPMGIEQYIVPAPADHTRVELPAVAPVRLSARALSGAGGAAGTAEITKLSRRPVATLDYAADPGGTLVTLEGTPGQDFTLAHFPRVREGTAGLPADRPLPPHPGPPRPRAGHLVTLLDAASGSGGFPLSAFVRDGDAVLASAVPRLGLADGFRASLTLDGRETLFFQAAESGRFRLKTRGAPHFRTVHPVDGDGAVPGDAAGVFDLQAGLYRLSIRPGTAATGPVEVDLAGEAAASPSPTPPPPAGPRLVSMLVPEPPETGSGQPLIAVAERTSAPAGMAIYPLPLTLAAGSPVLLGLGPDESRDLPLAAAAAGTLAVTDLAGQPVAFRLDGKPATGTAAFRAGARMLTVSNPGPAPLAVRIGLETRPAALPAAVPPPTTDPAPAAYPRLDAGQTYALDLAGPAPRRFEVAVTEPGLYRFETQGRLALRATLKTDLLPALASAAENGDGHNAVLERYLRAGRYRLEIAPLRNTAGRARIALTRAALADGEPLRIGEPARVGLSRGAGAILPFAVERPGRYDLQVLSLAEPVAFRLEDADGWPLLPAAQETDPFGAAGTRLPVTLDAGAYRLVLMPPALPARAVVRLTPQDEAPPVPQGHGPHPLALNGTQDFRWLEPAQPDDPRTPDQWDFALPGPTRLTLALTDGMAGTLLRDGADGFAAIGTVGAALPFDADVAGGRYRLAVAALARNNRLGYRLTSATRELLPGQPRRAAVPTRQSFSLDAPQTVRLASYGTQDVRAVLRDAEGRVLAEADDRQNDWNFVIVRALPAGRYTLTVEPAAPPAPGNDPGNEAYDDAPYDDEPYAEAAEDAPEAPALDPGLAPLDQLAAGAVEISLAHLPETAAEPVALTPGATATRTVRGAQTLVPLALGQGAVLIDAAPGAELLLSLERRPGADGPWETLGQADGPAPRLALLPAGGTYRLRIVALGAADDGGRTVTLRQLDLAPQADGAPLRFVLPDGMPLAVARLTVPAAAALDLGAAVPGLLSLSGPDGLAAPVGGPALLPAGEDLWLLRPAEAAAALTPKPLAPAGETPLVLRPTGPATLAAGAVPAGKLALWRADAPQGQPSLSLGGAGGIAPGAALAVGPDAHLRLTALGAAALPRVTVTRHLLDPPARRDATTPAATVPVPARGSLDLVLADGRKQLTLDLPAGIAAGLDGAPLLWRDDGPSSHQVETEAAHLRLYNPTAAPAQVALRQVTGADARLTVAPRQSFKRFLPAAGSLLLAVDAAAGQELRIEGTGAPAVWHGRDGQVRRGTRLPVAGPGTLALDHGGGLVAVWLDGPGAGLWPETAARSVALPQVLALDGPGQALTLTLTEPGLLHVRSTAPLIAGLRETDGGERVRLFPAGADWHRYRPAGPVELRLAAPQDGPLSGTLDLTVSPAIPVGEGLSDPVPLAAGDSRAFAFTVPRAGRIGVGVRALRDPAAVRLLDARGTLIGEGLVQYRTLQPGAYVLEVQAPADAALAVQAAVVGIDPPDRGPPPDVRQRYLDLVGLRPDAP